MKTAFQIFAVAFVIATVLYFFGSGVAAFRHVLFDGGFPPIAIEQLGRRGTATLQLDNERALARLEKANVMPGSVPYAGDEGVRAADVYENIEVLDDVNVGQFTRLMINMTTWVARDEGCAACHNVNDFADDSLYTKVVARRMLQMVRDINTNWTEHVAGTGVTCYTCHRGELVPPNIWFNNPGKTQASSFLVGTANPRHPVVTRALGETPLDPLSRHLEGDVDLRVTANDPRQHSDAVTIRQARGTHALMIHMSQSLGVNCAYCHNSRAFNSWEQSRPQRTTAWYGIRMVRELNNTYLAPLDTVLPTHRLGEAMGDAPKANCATCHNGVFKPLFGKSVLEEFPELRDPTAEQVVERSTVTVTSSE